MESAMLETRFSHLSKIDQDQILKAMVRPSVRECLPAINRVFEQQTNVQKTNPVLPTPDVRLFYLALVRIAAELGHAPKALQKVLNKKRKVIAPLFAGCPKFWGDLMSSTDTTTGDEPPKRNSPVCGVEDTSRARS